MPHLDKIVFDSPKTLKEKIERYLADPDARRAILMDQRQDLSKALSYKAGIARVLPRVAALLKDEPACT